MSAVTPSGAVLYDGSGVPISGAPALSLERMFALCPVCSIVYDFDNEQAATRDDVDLILALPVDAISDIPLLEIGRLVACLDHGGRVAVHGIADEQVQTAIAEILTMAGGGNA